MVESWPHESRSFTIPALSEPEKVVQLYLEQLRTEGCCHTLKNDSEVFKVNLHFPSVLSFL